MRSYRIPGLLLLLLLSVLGCGYSGGPDLQGDQQPAAFRGNWQEQDVFDTNTFGRLMEGLADINVHNRRGETLLFFAVVADGEVHLYSGNIAESEMVVYSEQEKSAVVRLLLRHGADPNLCNDRTGDTPLRQAILKGLQQVAEVFLESEFSDQLTTSTLTDA